MRPKLYIYMLTIFLILGSLLSCEAATNTTAKSERIQVIEDCSEYTNLKIIKVDSTEYLVNYSGGIIKLE